MKKLLMIAVAAAAVSTPAMADNNRGRTYGEEAEGWYDLNADVQSFCKFGTQNSAGSGINASVVAGTPGSTEEADGTFTLDIQDPNDDTVRPARGRYDIAYAVCNSPFDMTLSSQNGGLKNDATTSDDEFTSLVLYGVDFDFDGIQSSTYPMPSGLHTVESSSEARAGSARIRVNVRASDDLLLQGVYADRLTAALVPNLGG